MTQLMEKFFNGELNEEEWEQLGRDLAASTELTGHFAALAQEAYALTGLPAPRLGRKSLGSNTSRWGLGLLAFALGASMVLSWRAFYRPGAGPAVPAWSQVSLDGRGQATGFAEAPREVSAPKMAAAPEKPRTASEPVYRPRQVAARDTRSREGDGLAVVVDLPSRQMVSAAVLGRDGTLIRHLYSGVLGAGVWEFAWNGAVGQNTRVAPGTYRIEVKAQGRRHVKELKIQ